MPYKRAHYEPKGCFPTISGVGVSVSLRSNELATTSSALMGFLFSGIASRSAFLTFLQNWYSNAPQYCGIMDKFSHTSVGLFFKEIHINITFTTRLAYGESTRAHSSEMYKSLINCVYSELEYRKKQQPSRVDVPCT